MIRLLILVALAAGAAGAQTCTFTFSSYSQSVPATGGQYGPILITASSSSCQRPAAISTVDWITVNYGNTLATGDGRFGYTVKPNTTAATRTATITVGNATFTVTQAGVPCALSLPVTTSPSVPSSGGTFSFAVTATDGCAWTAVGTAAWITITSGASGTGSGAVTYTVAAQSGAQRTGTIRITAGTSQASYVVSQAGNCTYTVSPTSATFPAEGGAGSIVVTAASGCAWSAVSTAAWIQVGPAAQSPVSFTVAANATASARTGAITVASQTFSVSQAAGMLLSAVDNAASYAQGGVSPGEIVALFGALLGPETLSIAQLTSGQQTFPQTLSGTRVLFDGAPAPILYTSQGQVSAIVPYSLAGKINTQVQVEYQGNLSNAKTLAVVTSAPGLFALNTQGAGQGAILNQDYSVNGPANPAAKGSVVMIYATGEGQTTPAGVDGKLTPSAEPLPRPQLQVSVKIGGADATVQYAGGAPGLVAGLLQINAQIPDSITAGDAVPILVTIGTAQSQSQVTLAVAP